MPTPPPAPPAPHGGTAPAVTATAVLPPLPAQIGKYVVRAKLGEGSTSEVFLAYDAFAKRDVAIKRVHHAVLPDSRHAHFQRHFFAAEAALVGQLKHPNVVQLFDAVDDVEATYLVLEYVQGATLQRYCTPDNLLPLAQVIEIGFKCAMALGYCFRQGLIHRDVKPANLLATLDGDGIVDVKISDFGSVFNLGAERTQIYRVGSLAYMSPEQLDGDILDCRADMYSLAATLYHLVAGRPPFETVQQQALMAQIYNATPPPLTQLRAGVPPALHALIERGLAKQREQRPASWEEFAQALSSMTAAGELSPGAPQDVLDSERFTLLRALPFFADFGDVELWEVVHRATWQRHASGRALFRKGDEDQHFCIVAQGEVAIHREGQVVAVLGAGASMGEMAYLAPNPELRTHTVDIVVARPTTTVSFVPEALDRLSLPTRHLFDKALIGVLVRRLRAAHETMAHPRLV